MDIAIKHKGGKKNTNADVLYIRIAAYGVELGKLTQVNSSLTTPTLPDLGEVRRLQQEDSHCSDYLLT